LPHCAGEVGYALRVPRERWHSLSKDYLGLTFVCFPSGSLLSCHKRYRLPTPSVGKL
jgi:hypothetical protein